jgi:hypothetical protein
MKNDDNIVGGFVLHTTFITGIIHFFCLAPFSFFIFGEWGVDLFFE